MEGDRPHPPSTEAGRKMDKKVKYLLLNKKMPEMEIINLACFYPTHEQTMGKCVRFPWLLAWPELWVPPGKKAGICAGQVH